MKMRYLSVLIVPLLAAVAAACMADVEAASSSQAAFDAQLHEIGEGAVHLHNTAAHEDRPKERDARVTLLQRHADGVVRSHLRAGSETIPPKRLITTRRASDDPEVRTKAWNFRVFGYHAWWMRDLWKSYDLDLLDKVMYFELRVGPDGRIQEANGWPGASSDLTAALHEKRLSIVPTVAILEPSTFRSIFGSPSTARTLEREVMRIVKAANADGVHLNIEIFERVSADLRSNLTDFANGLRRSLTAYKSNAELSIFTPGFDHAEAYDEGALAAASDYLVVQGYDMHWVNGPEAGPLAPTKGWNGANWEGIVDRYIAEGVPAHKIVITVPFYGYEWPTESEQPGARTRGDAKTITYAPVDPDYLPLIQISAVERTARYGVQRDAITQTPYYTYRGEDGWYQGWYEDETSLEAKYRFVEERGLAGIAIFLLGYDGGKLMSSLY